MKPLGRKAYGSIGHIHGSRLGPGDHHVHEGQSAICTTKAPPDRKVWVQTKLDGSCVAVAKLADGNLAALGRAGYLAVTSPHEQHKLFAAWVEHRAHDFDAVLAPGERIVGEWLAMAHGTRYDLTDRDPFVAFDVMCDAERLTVEDVYDRLCERFATPDTIAGPMDPVEAMAVLDSYGAEHPEGVVYRVEGRKGVDFVAKWVRPDKVDGAYFDAETWNWHPNLSAADLPLGGGPCPRVFTTADGREGGRSPQPAADIDTHIASLSDAARPVSDAGSSGADTRPSAPLPGGGS